MKHFKLVFVLCWIVVTTKGHNSTKNSPSKTSEEQENKHSEKIKLLPDLATCGLQQTNQQSRDGTEADLHEFPWLVHIKLTDLEYEAEYGDRCNGALISDRYVLTDAYCAYDSLKVLLGEYSTNKNVICNENSDPPECTDPKVEVRIEAQIRDGRRENGPYDFALLRLADKVNFTDFIRPICLPLDEVKRPEKFDTLTFSGWGASSPVDVKKKKLIYDVVDAEVCYKEKKWLEGNVNFANVSFICVAPKENNTVNACNGEHGAPFMYPQETQWFLEGVVVDASSKNTPDSCSNDKPVNGIKVTPGTIKWILESIRL